MNFCRFTSKIPRNQIGCGFEDDEVFFFTDMANLRLTDVELVAELKKDNPEWFE